LRFVLRRPLQKLRPCPLKISGKGMIQEKRPKPALSAPFSGRRGGVLFLACGVLSSMFLLYFSSYAYADFRVCNATQRKVGVAVGYRARTGWISEGWWQIEPSSCKAVINGDLSSRFYYLYAEDADGAERWNGTVNMCVSENEFKIDGVKNCFPRGFQKSGFREIDTKNQASWMVRLTDVPAAAGGAKPAAGQSIIAPAGR